MATASLEYSIEYDRSFVNSFLSPYIKGMNEASQAMANCSRRLLPVTKRISKENTKFRVFKPKAAVLMERRAKHKTLMPPLIPSKSSHSFIVKKVGVVE